MDGVRGRVMGVLGERVGKRGVLGEGLGKGGVLGEGVGKRECWRKV